MPTQFVAATEEALNFGVELKIYDDAAWIATDRLREMGLAKAGLDSATYVVEPLGDLYRVAFLSKDGNVLKVSATVDVRSSGWDSMGSIVDSKAYDVPIPATDEESRLNDALQSAVSAQGLKLCANSPYNHIVLPDTRVGKHEYRVYFLLATDKPKQVPQAGHVLVRVGGDGKSVLEVRPLSLSCAIVDASDPRIAALSFSNLALDSPSEVQVLTFLRYKIPLFMVSKNGLFWSIDANGITSVKK
ncbi:MAG: hypothetical protein ACHQ1H_05425 [Nitrososphaerales archaeon]